MAGLVTVFGGSGFVGRHVVRALAKQGWRIRVAVRRPDLAGHLQPMGGVGQIMPLQANLRYPDSIMRAEPLEHSPCRISSNRIAETPHPPTLRPSNPFFPTFGPEPPKPPPDGQRWLTGSNGWRSRVATVWRPLSRADPINERRSARERVRRPRLYGHRG